MTFSMKAELILESSAPLESTMNGCVLTFSYEGQVVGQILESPDLKLPKGEGLEITIDAVFTVDKNMAGWNAFSKALASDESATMHVSARPLVTVPICVILFCMDMNYKDVEIEKDVTMIGLNGLTDLTVNSFDVVTNDDSPHPFLELSVTLFNPSMTSISPLGSLAVDCRLSTTLSRMGYVTGKHCLSLYIFLTLSSNVFIFTHSVLSIFFLSSFPLSLS
jgi:hypothetical protein